MFGTVICENEARASDEIYLLKKRHAWIKYINCLQVSYEIHMDFMQLIFTVPCTIQVRDQFLILVITNFPIAFI